MSFIKEIDESQLIPPFYGVAWFSVYRRVAICMPVPFNLLAAMGRSIWIFCVHGGRAMHQSSRDAYAQGRSDERKKHGKH